MMESVVIYFNRISSSALIDKKGYQKIYYDYKDGFVLPHQGIFLLGALMKGDLGNHQVMFLWSS